MNKFRLFLFLSLIAGFSSCVEHDFDYNPEKAITAQYNKAFIETFGQPSETQTWGFGERVLPTTRTLTRAAQTNSNQWGTTDDNSKYIDYPRPADITPEERAAVLAVFNERGKESYEPLVNWTNFFVQQVYCGPNGEKMNQLACHTNWIQTSYWPVVWEQQDSYSDDEVNNFNTGKYSGNAEQGCMLMWYSSTTEWSFKTSQSGGDRIYGHWRMEEINGNYYVGLDHEAWKQAPANANEEDKRDYIYNDWIIKIVPGKGENIPTPKTYECRIIAEDLTISTGTDFDFNDVVFDVKYTEGTNKTYITIQAAGGTLPLYVAGKEVHYLFAKENPDKGIKWEGNSGLTMINTNAPEGISGLEPVTFDIDGAVNPKDVEVTVYKNGAQIPLKAEVGEPTAKIAVNPDFKWLDERQDMRNYPNFTDYVKHGIENWY